MIASAIPVPERDAQDRERVAPLGGQEGGVDAVQPGRGDQRREGQPDRESVGRDGDQDPDVHGRPRRGRTRRDPQRRVQQRARRARPAREPGEERGVEGLAGETPSVIGTTSARKYVELAPVAPNSAATTATSTSASTRSSASAEKERTLSLPGGWSASGWSDRRFANGWSAAAEAPRRPRSLRFRPSARSVAISRPSLPPVITPNEAERGWTSALEDRSRSSLVFACAFATLPFTFTFTFTFALILVFGAPPPGC